PVRLKAPDEEEKQSAAVAIVMDRSGSMAGEKLEMAKSASIATAEVLGRNDSIGVYAFDSEAHVVAPMTRLTSTAAVAGQISAVASGGGTNLQPAFEQARDALRRVKAKVKHMIILTDGQTSGSGYEAMASQCRGEGITISTVSIGEGSHVALLQAIASSGGGQSYTTTDATGITRIFTQDTLMHTGRMMREEPFIPQMVEKHPMLAGFEKWNSPDLLGYVKTIRKATAQVPLVTDAGDPLLAHWRFGLGKVTAFTSDAKTRWASLWLARWPDFSRFWSQLLRETARPPQGRNMDLTAEMTGDDALLRVDLLEDAGTRANDARVQTDVFFVPADALGAPLKLVQSLALSQTGPGRYESRFRPTQPGVYLLRAQSGAEMVSAGLVFNPGSEASLGTVNTPLLEQVTRITGGQMLQPGQQPVLSQTPAVQYIELWPKILFALLLLFLLDVAIRRWEHVQGIWELVSSAWKPKRDPR
ncbi:MAG TPA: VWA domain-containing protein, partial [Prosthecobacter sp.]